jgi:hypothetical protein
MTRIGAVTLLCLLTSPLVWGLLGYHLYLIWAGTTTNESMKWSDWQTEMSDGYVFKREIPSGRQKDLGLEPAWTRWPVESVQIILRTEDGLPPTMAGAGTVGMGDWERVWNLKDVVWPRYRFHHHANSVVQEARSQLPSGVISP